MNNNKHISFVLLALALWATIIPAQVHSQTSESQLRPTVKRLVERLSEDQILHLGARVGYALKPETNNKYYKKYLRLKSQATDEELLALLENNSKLIVLYAYSALRDRNYKDLKAVFLKHYQDTSNVWEAGGCTGVIWRVNEFMLYMLQPKNNSGELSYLTHGEFEQYKKELGIQQ